MGVYRAHAGVLASWADDGTVSAMACAGVCVWAGAGSVWGCNSQGSGARASARAQAAQLPAPCNSTVTTELSSGSGQAQGARGKQCINQPDHDR